MGSTHKVKRSAWVHLRTVQSQTCSNQGLSIPQPPDPMEKVRQPTWWINALLLELSIDGVQRVPPKVLLRKDGRTTFQLSEPLCGMERCFMQCSRRDPLARKDLTLLSDLCSGHCVPVKRLFSGALVDCRRDAAALCNDWMDPIV